MMSLRTQFPSVSRLCFPKMDASSVRGKCFLTFSKEKSVLLSVFLAEVLSILRMSQFKLLTVSESIIVVTGMKCSAWLKLDHVCFLETTEYPNGFLMKNNIDIPKASYQCIQNIALL